MEMLNNTVSAALIINLLLQLAVLSAVGVVMTLLIRNKAAVYAT
ncbi:hypothetical protein P0136_03740 [Lentisphaerota bacterium ZTH]|nr:hypothetical protein P0136_03740 [Lentisphaerota bacterium ZTH]